MSTFRYLLILLPFAASFAMAADNKVDETPMGEVVEIVVRRTYNLVTSATDELADDGCGSVGTFSVNGVDRTVHHTQNHFDFLSSDPAVVELEGIERAISRAQIEFIATRTSAYLDCFY